MSCLPGRTQNILYSELIDEVKRVEDGDGMIFEIRVGFLFLSELLDFLLVL